MKTDNHPQWALDEAAQLRTHRRRHTALRVFIGIAVALGAAAAALALILTSAQLGVIAPDEAADERPIAP